MAWTTIPNGDLDPESPITTSLMTALRDNPPAIAAGDSGAPKVVDAAFSTNSINGDKLVSNSVDGGKIVSNTISALQIGSNAVSNSELNTVQTRSIGASLASGGTYTLTSGVYLINTASSSMWLQYHNGSTWVTLVSITAQLFTVFSTSTNGTNWRIYNSGGSAATWTRIRML